MFAYDFIFYYVCERALQVSQEPFGILLVDGCRFVYETYQVADPRVNAAFCTFGNVCEVPYRLAKFDLLVCVGSGFLALRRRRVLCMEASTDADCICASLCRSNLCRWLPLVTRRCFHFPASG